jgi:CARDB
VSLAALLALLGVLVGGELAAAAPRSDLVESSVSVPRGKTAAGSPLLVTDVVRNRGPAAAPRSTTAYYLSRDRVHDRSDLRLGTRAVRALRSGTSSRGSTTVTIAGSTLAGSYRVLACADDRQRIRESLESNNCRSTVRPVVVTSPGDRTAPLFAGLKWAQTCIPGPVDGGRSASYHLAWDPATDNVSPSSQIVYDVYQASSQGGEDFSAPTYSTPPGATSFATPPLAGDRAYYFVVRARDRAGNRDSNGVERAGMNLCL